MKTYEFVVVLAGADVMTEAMANDLYEAGCSDGSPYSGHGVAAIAFDRDSVTLEEAIKSAIADVERAGLQIERVEIGNEDLEALRA